jgi:hypothetical protein
MPFSFKQLNLGLGWLVWAIASLVYCFSIEPTASFWDCGEYIACAYRLEIGHPPGAPFFMLIGRFFSLFGADDPALAGFMINIMSALCSSFAILFLFWTITRLGIKLYGKTAADQLPAVNQWAVLGAGLVGSLAFTFSDTFWFNAVEGEVYATSSFFTSLVFWAALKWDEEDSHNPTGALRWLILISYLIGVSIGVHLLSLLTIPAICFVVYYKKFKPSRKGFLVTGLVSLFLLFFVQDLLIPKIVKFLSDYEVFFTNKLHFAFSSGTIAYFLLLVLSITGFIYYTITRQEKHYRISFYSAALFCGLAVLSAPGGSAMFTRLVMLGGILYAIHKFKTKTVTLHAVFLSFATLLIGYSSFFVLVIRSQANPPMDENDPENAPNMLSYLLREQYGAAPLLYGQYYNAPHLPRSQFGSGDPLYAKDRANGNYRVIDSRKNSIPKYEKEFCTFFPRMYSPQASHVAGYKYWGNVHEHHKNKVVEDQGGQAETIEVPTMAANLGYFFNYQVGYMYLRYFFWNFIGRQNDVQGTSRNILDGNWMSGIKVLDDMRLDTDTAKTIYRNKNNFASNHFYGLPFILGLCGLFFHFKRNKGDAWAVLCFFLVTGVAIIVYLNQSPLQVRERDYAYVGSFYAFAIWIGLGVLYLADLLGKKQLNTRAIALAVGLGLVVPGLMAKEGWNDHDRSLRTLSRDMAINYLQSCAPNAILFTNGDCDTFPLWYAQDVEGIRTDVRVVCLSLLNSDWYIRQMRRAAWKSAPVPFSIPEQKLEAEKMSYILINGRNPAPVKLQDAFAAAVSDDPNSKLDNEGELLDILPARNLYLDVDPAAVLKDKSLAIKDTARLEKRMSWSLGNRGHILKSDLMVLDLLIHNNWERPIYFTSPSSDACVGLSNYLQLEGITFRLVPVKQSEAEAAEGGMVNTEVMYDNIMTKFKWGGMNKKGVNLDENCLRMPMNIRMQMGILANALIRENKKEKAKHILETCMREMPDETVPFDASMFNVCRAWYGLGDSQKAKTLARKLFDMFEGDLKIYNAMKPNQRPAYSTEISQAKGILRNLAAVSHQYGDTAQTNEFMQRLAPLMPREELMPEQEREPIVP